MEASENTARHRDLIKGISNSPQESAPIQDIEDWVVRAACVVRARQDNMAACDCPFAIFKPRGYRRTEAHKWASVRCDHIRLRLPQDSANRACVETLELQGKRNQFVLAVRNVAQIEAFNISDIEAIELLMSA